MKRIKAFTLVETLIVIVVFCVWILVVLQWLSQTLKNKDYANVQIKSAFFAREWIELMFNLRDANYHKKMPWNCIFRKKEISSPYNENLNPFCKGYFWPWDILKVWMWSDSYISIKTWSLEDDFDKNFENFQIYFHNSLNGTTWFRYDYDPDDGEQTWFARYLVVKWVDDDGDPLDSEKILKIESHVLYQRWTITWEKVMETFIGNYEFKQ